MICIYHSRDLDGAASGAIVKRKYPDAKLIGYDYGQPVPYDQIPAGEEVIMIDVSLPMDEIMKLSYHCDGNLIWIDHHKSAIDAFLSYPIHTPTRINSIGTEQIVVYKDKSITAVLKDGIAACEIAWQYFFYGIEMPEAIKLLGEYDTWRNTDKDRWENEILPFQFGMRMFCSSPETFPATTFVDNEKVERTIQEGKTVLKYQAQINERQCKNTLFEFDLDGLRAIGMNNGGFNSDVFKSVYNEDKHDIMVMFQLQKNKMWQISFYSTKKDIDCSVIATKYKGGGHKGAAGTTVKQLPKFISDIIYG